MLAPLSGQLFPCHVRKVAENLLLLSRWGEISFIRSALNVSNPSCAGCTFFWQILQLFFQTTLLPPASERKAIQAHSNPESRKCLANPELREVQVRVETFQESHFQPSMAAWLAKRCWCWTVLVPMRFVSLDGAGKDSYEMIPLDKRQAPSCAGRPMKCETPCRASILECP